MRSFGVVSEEKMAKGAGRAMTILQPKVSLPVCIAGTVILLLSLYVTMHFFSGMRRHKAVRELQAYFNEAVCPRSEFAPHLRNLPLNSGPLRAGKLPETDLLCPKEWVDKEAEELNSPYYLRTGQQISALASMEPLGSWYGLEAWIRDILASKSDPFRLACIVQSPGIIRRSKTKQEEKT